MAEKKDSRCWPGYEPVPGKEQHEQGSCRKKPASKSTAGEKKFQKKRQDQLDEWQKGHPKTRRSAAQHLHSPDDKPKAQKRATKKATKKATAGTRKRARK